MKKLALAVFLSLTAVVRPALTQDLSTTGVEFLRPFLQKAEAGARPVTVLSFGDSMADAYRSIGYVIVEKLLGRLGSAGYALDSFDNAELFVLTNGATVLEPSQFWFAQSYSVPPGGGVWWEVQAGAGRSPSGGGVLCDRVGIFFAAQPNGGLFALSISTNLGPWTSARTLDGYSAGMEGRYAQMDVPLGYYRLRVDGQTGTNIIIGTQLLNLHSNGLQVAFAYYGGISLSDVTNVPLSIRLPIFQALAPDLILWHMKEPLPPLRAGLEEMESWWSGAAPDCAVLYLGTPYVADDTNPVTAFTVEQNTIVRAFAQDYSRTYMDCMTPSQSYEWMATNDFMADGTHPNLEGSTYLANFAWDELGLFSLRAQREVSLTENATSFLAAWPTTAGINYELQRSFDLLTWDSIYSVLGDGAEKSYTGGLFAHPCYFRLRLRGVRP